MEIPRHMGRDDRRKKCLAISDKDGYKTLSHRPVSDDDCVDLPNSDHSMMLRTHICVSHVNR